MVLCKEEYAKKLDSRTFPGMQGGPLEHVIAAKELPFTKPASPNSKPMRSAFSTTCRRWPASLTKKASAWFPAEATTTCFCSTPCLR
nr:hypothetical protein [Allobaculum sp. Allo2]